MEFSQVLTQVFVVRVAINCGMFSNYKQTGI